MFALLSIPGLQAKMFPFAKRKQAMPSRVSNWMIAAGALAMFAGLCVLPAGLGEHADSNLLSLGACLVSLGALIAASGLYLKARALQATNGPATPVKETKNSLRRVRGGCDACRGDQPVIHCKVHQLHLCATCLAEHYDFRSCAYVPSTRQSAKGGRAMAARVRGA